ncbi:MAG: DUF3616 domain-containing protein [Myxococcota bacterium]|nr:DUF3616 domain-containing protein [Deltaproteobacteria bacterium]MDQ3340576.1 DUF3616 domain-containing protein [Myxococcota bacterium]
MAHGLLLSLLVGCTAHVGGEVVAIDAKPNDRKPSTDAALDAPIDAAVSLSTDPSRYRGTCDGSAAAAVDVDHLIGFSDNDQRIRVFKRGTMTMPIVAPDIGGSLALGGTSPKVDFEDVERVGNRLYAISSHGRKNDGSQDGNRYRFAAIDVSGQSPSFQFAVAGSSSSLLSDLLVTANWTSPNQPIIDALRNASKLEEPTNTNLAPKSNGVNIEGLTHAPVDGLPGRMLIGLRNPRPGGKAIVVSLVNADTVIAGGAARFGEGFTLDLGNLGIRGMTWSPVLRQVLIIAGPHDDQSGPFKLYRWPGTIGTTPTYVSTITPPSNMRPEAVVAYGSTNDIAIVFDGDDQQVGSVACDNAPEDQRSFTDVVSHVE